LVKHSKDKDEFLEVAIKWMIETQILEDELKEVGKFNLVPLTEKQELEAKLAEESQAKDGNHFTDSLFSSLDHVRVNSKLTVASCCSIQGSAHGPWHCSR
jgi:hypothetical protein